MYDRLFDENDLLDLNRCVCVKDKLKKIYIFQRSNFLNELDSIIRKLLRNKSDLKNFVQIYYNLELICDYTNDYFKLADLQYSMMEIVLSDFFHHRNQEVYLELLRIPTLREKLLFVLYAKVQGNPYQHFKVIADHKIEPIEEMMVAYLNRSGFYLDYFMDQVEDHLKLKIVQNILKEGSHHLKEQLNFYINRNVRFFNLLTSLMVDGSYLAELFCRYAYYYWWSCLSSFDKIFMINKDKLQITLQKLIQSCCINTKYIDHGQLVHLAKYGNVKQIFVILLNYNNSFAIQEFIDKYKENEEIKHLIPLF